MIWRARGLALLSLTTEAEDSAAQPGRKPLGAVRALLGDDLVARPFDLLQLTNVFHGFPFGETACVSALCALLRRFRTAHLLTTAHFLYKYHTLFGPSYSKCAVVRCARWLPPLADNVDAAVMPRRFPPPWSVEETPVLSARIKQPDCSFDFAQSSSNGRNRGYNEASRFPR